MIELQTEEPQKNKTHTWRLYWFHATDPDASCPADAEALAKAGFTSSAECARVLNDLQQSHVREISAVRGELERAKAENTHLRFCAEYAQHFVNIINRVGHRVDERDRRVAARDLLQGFLSRVSPPLTTGTPGPEQPVFELDQASAPAPAESAQPNPDDYGKPALLALSHKWENAVREYARDEQDFEHNPVVDCARELRAMLAPGKNMPPSAFCDSSVCSAPAQHHLCKHCFGRLSGESVKVAGGYCSNCANVEAENAGLKAQLRDLTAEREATRRWVSDYLNGLPVKGTSSESVYAQGQRYALECIVRHFGALRSQPSPIREAKDSTPSPEPLARDNAVGTARSAQKPPGDGAGADAYEPFDRGAGTGEAKPAEPRCVCGHTKSQHEPMGGVLGCSVVGCACGTGCIHEGFVDADSNTQPTQKPAFMVGTFVKLRHQLDSARWEIAETRVMSLSNRQHRFKDQLTWWDESRLVPCEEPADPAPLSQVELPGDMGPVSPIPMWLTCPVCMSRHIDEGEFATKPHHTHSCQTCGLTWRPAVVPTVGVAFLPGFKNGGDELAKSKEGGGK